MKSVQNLVAIAIAGCLCGGMAFAKGPDTAAESVTPASLKASEDYPVTYPGGTPPAPVAGALDADDSTYNRVISSCAGLSGTGTAVFYDTISLTNTGAASATIDVDLDCSGDDSYLTAYLNSFNPAAPLDNCIDSDDDDGVGNCSRLTGLAVPAGATLVLVVSSFGNGAQFAWSADFTGSVPVELQSFQIE